MFRKAQTKLFGIITAVLLALFIAVLGSVNIIMKMVMERQSRTVLKQIAAGVEYDDTISDFNYLPPDKSEPDDRAEGTPPPSKPTGEPGSDAAASGASDSEEETTSAITTETTTTTTTIAEDTTAPAETEPDSEEPTEDYQQEYDEPYEDDPTEPPVQEQPVVTAPPATTPPVQTNPPTNPPTTQNKDKASEKKGDDKKGDDKKEDHGGNNNDQNQYNSGQNQQQYPQWPGDPNMWWWGWWGWGQPYDPNWNNYWGGYYNGDQQQYNPQMQWGWPYYQSPKPECAKDGDEKCEPNDDDDFGINDDDTQNEEEDQSVNEEGLLPLSNTVKNDKFNNASTKQLNSKRAGAEQVPKNLGSIDFFIVMADTSGNFLASRNNDELSEDTAQKYITKILDSGTETGTLNNFQFYRQDKDNGTLLVFTDKTAELDMLNKLYRTTIAIGIISFLALSAAAFFLSRQVIKPLKIAFEKQKQFVSDASHELKTPVTVISANADVLAGEIGENKWLTYIKSQTERMNILVNDLLHLTRLENNTSTDFIVTEFDLSKAIVNTALPFECQAFETNKNFVVQVEEGISISGSEKHIKQMAAIFIDNALKYSKDGGTVKVTLERLGDKKVFSVFNTGQGIKEEDKDKIFERFFRSDESRNRATGGYGLGLAIAKSIIDKHKFKVHVENNEGSSICFVVTM
ncbi:MAG: hypothetical protein GXY08_05215 [Ruminococcus sp.]|nr:hypothetical protein [Ruminococcus sp.]